MALRSKIGHLIRLEVGHHSGKLATIGEVTVVKPQPFMIQQVPNTLKVVHRCAPNQAMNVIAFPRQKLSKVGAILAGDPGNECRRSHARNLPRGCAEGKRHFFAHQQ